MPEACGEQVCRTAGALHVHTASEWITSSRVESIQLSSAVASVEMLDALFLCWHHCRLATWRFSR